MKVGFIGIGTMGSAMAKCILDAGHELTVCDLQKSAAEGLLKAGAQWAEKPAQAAHASDVLFTSLPGPSQVQAVVLDRDTGVLAGLKRGSVYVDTSTNSPMVFRKIARECLDKGVEVLDAPVSRRPPELTMMVGGDKATFARCEPVLKAIAKNLIYVGESGSGMIAKLMTQYMGYTYQVAMAEAFIIAAKAGVDPAVLAKIVPISAGSGNAAGFMRTLLNRGLEPPAPRVGYNVIAKDMTLACEVAQQFQATASTGLMARDIFQRAEAQGMEYTAGIVTVLEQMAGFKLPASRS